MLYDFDTCPDRRLTESEKWQRYPPDVLPLWVADMDFISPEPVIRELLERVEHGVFGYPKELSGLRELIVDRLDTRYQWRVQPDDIVFIPGVIRGFNLVAHTVTEPGAGVLFQTPIYPPVLAVPRNAGMKRQTMALTRNANGAYSVDWDAFEAAITTHTRLFILCNPHNPVGRVFNREELAHMAEICLRHDVLICSDEIHCDLVYAGHEHVPVASLSPEIARNTITLMAPSKTFNIAGLDCSFAIVQDQALRKRYQHAHRGLLSGVNIMGWVAAQAAYRDGQEWLTQLLVYLEANRDYLHDFLRTQMPEIVSSIPEGTYLSWLDCRDLGLEQPFQFFLEHARVALNDGAAFGRSGQGFVRLNFGCPRATLVEALNRMRDAIRARKSETAQLAS